ncbi:MAG: MurR/RpiR family transcriptional regulator [Rhodospirillaceae bacterium]|jgi:DNA-binding MurR/RpiR family transcriptional regulator|nr:MurR/RpiR family transcriptional regulator [Rhodospirillaceae bacterium]MBT4220155.1 MurR/RpiR family transcriptional regulator [Rhodospirillaceae bacterium]MBT5014081.1 MurR/RpiR family transcriptional regulator [Rhodospirillaceae bacterium]MBT5309847.1 MurR/RpiR family transcriptional regulator [Rhodospirillaceae bacterium]MBT6407257.1 MurR/RpiR family transcriptional regulator [Rhodospirillaceae bacterium]
MEFATFTKRIADAFPDLSPQLQVAARHVLDRPDDVALMSMRALAASAGIHPSTMVRLAKAFGCDSYKKFRTPFQERLRVLPKGYLARARSLQERGTEGEETLTQEVLSANLANLRDTFSINSFEKFEASAQAISNARRVYVVGMRGVFPVAYFFHYTYSMFRDNAVLLDSRGGAFSDDLRHFGKDDVIFAISFAPYTFETVRAVEFACEHGGTAIAMTDSPVSPLAKNAEHVLIVKNESPSFYHSVAAAVTATEELIALMMVEGGQQALKSIEESEQQLEGFQAYWRQNPKKKNKPRKRKS